MHRMGLVLLLTAFAASGCGDDNGSTPDTKATMDSGPAADTGAPSAAFKGLDPYSVAKGELTIDTETTGDLTKVELLVDGKVVVSVTAAPFSLKWDTTKTQDGIRKLSLKAHGTAASATSDERPVVVLNNGEEATFAEPSTMTMTITPGVDNHVKIHWTMPVGIKKVISVLSWKNSEFKMEIAIGTGNCPHSGEKAADATSDTSPVVVEYGGTANLASVMWFTHAGATNEAELAGKSAEVTLKAFLLK